MEEERQKLFQETEAVRIQIRVCFRRAQMLGTSLARGIGAREVALTITKLQEAESWMKVALDELSPPENTIPPS
jgi:hypothetical protein